MLGQIDHRHATYLHVARVRSLAEESPKELTKGQAPSLHKSPSGMMLMLSSNEVIEVRDVTETCLLHTTCLPDQQQSGNAAEGESINIRPSVEGKTTTSARKTRREGVRTTVADYRKPRGTATLHQHEHLEC